MRKNHMKQLDGWTRMVEVPHVSIFLVLKNCIENVDAHKEIRLLRVNNSLCVQEDGASVRSDGLPPNASPVLRWEHECLIIVHHLYGSTLLKHKIDLLIYLIC